jgi:hypothetical protein
MVISGPMAFAGTAFCSQSFIEPVVIRKASGKAVKPKRFGACPAKTFGFLNN